MLLEEVSFHALSVEEGYFRYDRNSDSITFLAQPGFLAKNQLPESFPEPIVIPDLSQFCGSDTDDRLLCPVRAVRASLARVKSKRSGRKRLFLPLKGSKDISPSTISRWICDVIKLTYADLPSDLSFMKISAHEVNLHSGLIVIWLPMTMLYELHIGVPVALLPHFISEIWPQLDKIYHPWDLL